MEFVLKDLQNEILVSRLANVHFFEFEKNFFTKNDRHPFSELVFVASGELMVSSDEYNGRLAKHEMILHHEREAHSLSCTAESAPTIIIIGFECESEALLEFSKRPILLGEEDIKELAAIVKEARNVFAPPYNIPTSNMRKKKNRPFGSEQMLRLLIEGFLIKIVREYGRSESVGEKKRTRQAPVIREIISYVDENFLEKITIDELAFIFKTNRATLCKEFKKSTDKTLISYIADKKIALIKEVILNSDLTFTEVSERMHFESVHYFTRFFKKHVGVTPKEFKAKKRQEVI